MYWDTASRSVSSIVGFLRDTNGRSSMILDVLLFGGDNSRMASKSV